MRYVYRSGIKIFLKTGEFERHANCVENSRRFFSKKYPRRCTRGIRPILFCSECQVIVSGCHSIYDEQTDYGSFELPGCMEYLSTDLIPMIQYLA